MVISEYADELLDNLIYCLIYRLKNEQAAEHLLDGIDSIYDRLETNPFQFLLSRDIYFPFCSIKNVNGSEIDRGNYRLWN